jgi:hypothetical protein
MYYCLDIQNCLSPASLLDECVGSRGMTPVYSRMVQNGKWLLDESAILQCKQNLIGQGSAAKHSNILFGH